MLHLTTAKSQANYIPHVCRIRPNVKLRWKYEKALKSITRILRLIHDDLEHCASDNPFSPSNNKKFVVWATAKFDIPEEAYQILTFPLAEGARDGRLDLVEKYLDNFDFEEDFPELPFDLVAQAAHSNSPEVMLLLLARRGIDIDGLKHGIPPLIVSAALGKSRTMKCLLENGASLQTAEKCWSPELWSSIQSSQNERYMEPRSKEFRDFWRKILSGQVPQQMPDLAETSSLFKSVEIRSNFKELLKPEEDPEAFVQSLSDLVVLLGACHKGSQRGAMRVEATTCKRYIQAAWGGLAWSAFEIIFSQLAIDQNALGLNLSSMLS
jgi:hypothetical protein